MMPDEHTKTGIRMGLGVFICCTLAFCGVLPKLGRCGLLWKPGALVRLHKQQGFMLPGEHSKYTSAVYSAARAASITAVVCFCCCCIA